LKPRFQRLKDKLCVVTKSRDENQTFANMS
jgi:hypothetical protein